MGSFILKICSPQHVTYNYFPDLRDSHYFMYFEPLWNHYEITFPVP